MSRQPAFEHFHGLLVAAQKDAMNRNPKNKFEVPGDIDHDRSDDICERCKQNPVRMRNVHQHLCEGCHQFVNGVLLLALLRFEQRLGELKAEQSDTGYYSLLENQRLKAQVQTKSSADAECASFALLALLLTSN